MSLVVTRGLGSPNLLVQRGFGGVPLPFAYVPFWTDADPISTAWITFAQCGVISTMTIGDDGAVAADGSVMRTTAAGNDGVVTASGLARAKTSGGVNRYVADGLASTRSDGDVGSTVATDGSKTTESK